MTKLGFLARLGRRRSLRHQIGATTGQPVILHNAEVPSEPALDIGWLENALGGAAQTWCIGGDDRLSTKPPSQAAGRDHQHGAIEPEALDIALDCARPSRLLLIGPPPSVHPETLRHLPERIDWLAAEAKSNNDIAQAWARRARCVQPLHADTDLAGGDASHLPAGPAFLSDRDLTSAAGRIQPAAEDGFAERFREFHEKRWPILYAPHTRDGEEAFAVATLFALLRKTGAVLLLAPQGRDRHEPVYRDLIKYQLPIIRHNRLMTSFVPRKNRIYYIEDDTTAAQAFAAAHIVLAGGTLARNPLMPINDDPTTQPGYWEQVLASEIPAAGPGLDVVLKRPPESSASHAQRCDQELHRADTRNTTHAANMARDTKEPLAARIRAARNVGWLLQADDPEVLANRILSAHSAPTPRSERELRDRRDALRHAIRDALS